LKSTPASDSRSDPMHAMAHAPTEGLVAAITAAAKTSRDIQSTQPASGHAISELGIARSPCRAPAAEALGADCAPLRIVKPDPAYAASRRPAIATVPIGHRHDPAALEPAAVAVAARPADAEPGIPAEAVPAAAPGSPALPLPAAKRGSTSGRSGARAANGADAHATAASMHPRRATTATAKTAESEDRRVAHRRAKQGAAGMDAFLAGDEVSFDHRRKQVAAFTKALGIHMPPRLLDLAGKALE
jgi:hypothetical protein